MTNINADPAFLTFTFHLAKTLYIWILSNIVKTCSLIWSIYLAQTDRGWEPDHNDYQTNHRNMLTIKQVCNKSNAFVFWHKACFNMNFYVTNWMLWHKTIHSSIFYLLNVVWNIQQNFACKMYFAFRVTGYLHRISKIKIWVSKLSDLFLQGWKICVFPRNVSNISHFFLCISLFENHNFPPLCQISLEGTSWFPHFSHHVQALKFLKSLKFPTIVFIIKIILHFMNVTFFVAYFLYICIKMFKLQESRLKTTLTITCYWRDTFNERRRNVFK